MRLREATRASGAMPMIAFVRACILACALAWLVPASALAASDSVDAARAAELLLEETNRLRAEQGLRKLSANAALTSAAQSFADYMARTDRYAHDADGREPADRASRKGYAYCLVAENIAYYERSSGFETDELARTFVEGWKRSPPHRRNLLDPDVVDFGAAVAKSSASGRWYGVQMFGMPASAGIRFEIANRTDAAIDYRLGERRYSLPPRVTRTHETCRAGSLVVDESAANPESAVKPAGGDRFVLVRDANGRIALQRP